MSFPLHAYRLKNMGAADLAHNPIPLVLDTTGWPDRSALAHDASANTPAERPLYRANRIAGLGVLEFDGIDDVLAVNGSTGLGQGPGRGFVIYRNPDPGTTKWQRMFSARATTSELDYVDGYMMMPETDGTGVVLPQSIVRRKEVNQSALDQSRQSFRIETAE